MPPSGHGLRRGHGCAGIARAPGCTQSHTRLEQPDLHCSAAKSRRVRHPGSRHRAGCRGGHDRVRPGRAVAGSPRGADIGRTAANSEADEAHAEHAGCVPDLRQASTKTPATTRSPPSWRWPKSSTPSATPTARAAWPRKSWPRLPATSRIGPSDCSPKSADRRNFLEGPPMRLALGISYNGQAYEGWQSQPSGRTVQDQLEARARPVRRSARLHRLRRPHRCRRARTHAGRALRHDLRARRASPGCAAPTASCRPTSPCNGPSPCPTPSIRAPAPRPGAMPTCVLESPVRPSVDAGRVGWVFRPLDEAAMREAASLLIGRARLHLVSRLGLPGPVARQDDSLGRRSADAAPIGASSSRPTPSCTT